MKRRAATDSAVRPGRLYAALGCATVVVSALKDRRPQNGPGKRWCIKDESYGGNAFDHRKYSWYGCGAGWLKFKWFEHDYYCDPIVEAEFYFAAMWLATV